MALIVGDINTFAMEELSNSPFLSYGDKGIQESCPGTVVEFYGACFALP